MRDRFIQFIVPALAILLALPAARANAAPNPQDATPAVTLTPLGTYDSGFFDAEAAEIVTYDPATQRAFSVNATDATIDMIDISDPTAPTLISQIDVTPYGAIANSVDVYDAPHRAGHRGGQQLRR